MSRLDDVMDIIRGAPKAEDRLEKRLKDLEQLKVEMTGRLTEANELIGKTLQLIERTAKLIEDLQAAVKRLTALVEAEARQDERERIEKLSGYG